MTHFLGTNVLIYMFDDVDLHKRGRARGLVRDALASGRGIISHQVVQETLNVLARKLGATPACPANLLILSRYRPLLRREEPRNR